MRQKIIAGIIILWSGAALADPVNTRAALAQLFDSDDIALQIANHLSDADKAAIRALVPLMAQQMRTPARYYGSIAYAEGEGLVSASLQGAFNFHTVASADAAAIAACRKAATAAPRTCRLAARILPRGYRERTMTLSQGATKTVRSDFARARAPKAFARSVATGAWGVGASVADAVAACNKGTSGRRDCAAVIRD